MSLLAVDVGAGTQDILILQDGAPLEGSTKLVLPSQTVIVGRRIDAARAAGRDIFLRGPTMGGGPCVGAIRRHLSAGLRVYATPSAAATISDNLDRVAEMGVVIQEDEPGSAEVITTGDLDLSSLRRALSLFDLVPPVDIAVAVQDHGHSPDRSNRLVRFEHLEGAMRMGGGLEAFAYRRPPDVMTRMRAVWELLEGEGCRSLLMDTGPAAIFGAATDPRCLQPALIINIGNGHTVAAILEDDSIRAIFEHHTSQLSPERLGVFVQRLCSGSLRSSEIFKDGGHGACIIDLPERIRSTLVTGPQREQFLRAGVLSGAVAASPGGDMMIAGCLGLAWAWRRRDDLWR